MNKNINLIKQNLEGIVFELSTMPPVFGEHQVFGITYSLKLAREALEQFNDKTISKECDKN